MREDGDGALQAAGAVAFGDQKPEEHPQGGRALLGCGPPTRLTALQDKLSQGPRIQRVRLLPDAREQLANVNPVIVEGALSQVPRCSCIH